MIKGKIYSLTDIPTLARSSPLLTKQAKNKYISDEKKI